MDLSPPRIITARGALLGLLMVLFFVSVWHAACARPWHRGESVCRKGSFSMTVFRRKLINDLRNWFFGGGCTASVGFLRRFSTGCSWYFRIYANSWISVMTFLSGEPFLQRSIKHHLGRRTSCMDHFGTVTCRTDKHIARNFNNPTCLYYSGDVSDSSTDT